MWNVYRASMALFMLKGNSKEWCVLQKEEKFFYLNGWHYGGAWVPMWIKERKDLFQV